MPPMKDSATRPEITRPRRAIPPSAIDVALDEVVGTGGAGAQPGGGRGDVFVAVVHTIDSICFVAASTLRDELLRQLAGYVRQRAPEALWAAGAARVHALLDAGELEAAIDHYFATVGQRWDEEWLVTGSVSGRSLATPMLALQR